MCLVSSSNSIHEDNPLYLLQIHRWGHLPKSSCPFLSVYTASSGLSCHGERFGCNAPKQSPLRKDFTICLTQLGVSKDYTWNPRCSRTFQLLETFPWARTAHILYFHHHHPVFSSPPKTHSASQENATSTNASSFVIYLIYFYYREAAQVLINTQVDKKAVVFHLHNGILFRHEKRNKNLILCDSISGPGEHYATWNKPVRERQVPYDVTYRWNLMNKINKVETDL